MGKTSRKVKVFIVKGKKFKTLTTARKYAVKVKAKRIIEETFVEKFIPR